MPLIPCYVVTSNAKCAVILLRSILLAIGCHAQKCVMLAYLVHYRGPEALASPLHPFKGIISFSMALSLLLLSHGLTLKRKRLFISLSKRCLLHITIALLLMLISVALHSYLKLHSNNYVPAQELFAWCNGNVETEATGCRLTSMFGEVEWCAGILSGHGDSPSLNYWILRSYDPKKLYHLPDTGFVRGAAASRRTT